MPPPLIETVQTQSLRTPSPFALAFPLDFAFCKSMNTLSKRNSQPLKAPCSLVRIPRSVGFPMSQDVANLKAMANPDQKANLITSTCQVSSSHRYNLSCSVDVQIAMGMNPGWIPRGQMLIGEIKILERESMGRGLRPKKAAKEPQKQSWTGTRCKSCESAEQTGITRFLNLVSRSPGLLHAQDAMLCYAMLLHAQDASMLHAYHSKKRDLEGEGKQEEGPVCVFRITMNGEDAKASRKDKEEINEEEEE